MILHKKGASKVSHPTNKQHVPHGPHRPRPNAQSQNTSHQPPTPHVRLILWEQIVPNPNQPRRRFPTAPLQELADSIRQHGILQPLLVCPIGLDRYQIIAGERRHRAAKLAGVTHVPVIVQQATDQQQAELALIENLQREDLTPVEAARAFRTLINEFGLTQLELSQRIGKSPPVISRILRLLQLPEEMLDALQRGEILERHTRALLTVKNKELREQLCQQVLADKLTASETEQRIGAALTSATDATLSEPAPGLPAGSSPEPHNEIVCLDAQSLPTLEQQLSARFDTEVTVGLDEESTGYIMLECHDAAHLLRLAQTLMNARF
jgi:ParB/RepB/Spo0J family partition protein